MKKMLVLGAVVIIFLFVIGVLQEFELSKSLSEKEVGSSSQSAVELKTLEKENVVLARFSPQKRPPVSNNRTLSVLRRLNSTLDLPRSIFLYNAPASPTQCGDVNSSLKLTANIRANGTCFTVKGTNLVINGNGFSITGDGTGDGINITDSNLLYRTNITIRNFAGINNFSSAVRAISVLNSSIYNNVINNSVIGGVGGNGISFTTAGLNNNISYNTINLDGNRGIAITLEGSCYYCSGDNNAVSYNKIRTSGLLSLGIYFRNGNTNTISYNDILTTGQGSTGIQISDSIGNLISYNNISTTGNGSTFQTYGIYLYSGRYPTKNTLLNNIVTSKYEELHSHFSIDNSLNNLVYNNQFGEINWTDNVFLTHLKLYINNDQGIGIGKNLFIWDNVVAVNTSAFSPAPSPFNPGDTNSSAKITLRNLGFATVNEIRKLNAYSTDSSEIISSGLDCLGTTCQIISYDNATGMLVFSTASLGSFAAVG